MAESGEEWELSKENIRPIQQGRKQKVLKVALAPHPEDVIAQQRHSFENELRTYAGNDPLYVWCNYIKWVEQNFPKGGREGHIKQLMERCLAILKDEKKYFDDERFIDIMLKYANLSGKPLEVYNFMYSNKIGCKSSKFFINWSWELEQLGNLKRADEVITEGFHRRAEPFEKIQSYHADFQIRLASKIKTSVEQNTLESENGRSAFSVLKPQKKNLAPVLRTGEGVIEKKSLILGRQQAQPKSTLSNHKVPFKIYNSENVNPLPVQSQSVVHNTLHPENYKENELKPSKWNKIRVKSRGQNLKTSHDAHLNFQLHCDDENEEQDCTPRSVPKTSSILSTRRRTPSPPMALFEPPDPMKRPMYPKDKVYGGAEEYSLEEIRAAAWLENKKKIEQEMLLAEQQRKIQEQAENEAKLKKQLELLEKKVELLQIHITSGANISGLLSSNSKGTNSRSSEMLKSNQEDKPSLEIPSNSKPTSTSELLIKNKLLENSNEKRNICNFSDAEKLPQDFSNKTLSHSTEDESKQGLNEKFDIFSQKHISNKVSEENHLLKSCESTDKLPFTFFHDPTTKITSNNDVIDNDNVFEPIQPNKTNDISLFTDKLPISIFRDPTENYGNICSKQTINFKEAEDLDVQSFPKESTRKIPLTIYSDPTENIHLDTESVKLSDKNSIVTSAKTKQVDHLHNTSKKTQLSITVNHQPTEAIHPTTESFGRHQPTATQESSDEDYENIPPFDYVQECKKRELAGVLQPSKNILFIPLEEQKDSEDDSDQEDDFIYEIKKHGVDETLIPPSNTEQFSAAKFLSSTPFVAREGKVSVSEMSNHQNTRSNKMLHLSNNPECINLNAVDSQINDRSAMVNPETKLFKEPALSIDLKGTAHSRLPNILSVIMETSSENYSKSSSSSSASLTKSSNLGHSSAQNISLQRQKTELQPKSSMKANVCSFSEAANHDSKVNCTNLVEGKFRNEENSETPLNLFSVDLDPFDPTVNQEFLKFIDLAQYKGLHECNKSIRSVKLGENITIGTDTYTIESLIAEGSYAKVYKAVKQFQMYSDYSSETLALKVCKKSNEWEYYICSEIQQRLSQSNKLPDVRNSVMKILSALKYQDGIVIVNEYSSFGTLLDVINFYKKQNSPVPEMLIMFFTLEMLHIVSKLHECNIIHGDIKPDNFLLVSVDFDPNISEHTSKSIEHLQLIDFGRAIDLNLYDRGVCFTSTLSTPLFKCNEMKDNKPWTFQLDWYGVLSCIHTMLFSEYMTVKKKDGIWQIEKKFKRYWTTSLWEPLFNELLNIPECYKEPDVTVFTKIIESKMKQSGFIGQLERFSVAYSAKK